MGASLLPSLLPHDLYRLTAKELIEFLKVSQIKDRISKIENCLDKYIVKMGNINFALYKKYSFTIDSDGVIWVNSYGLRYKLCGYNE